MSDRIKLRPPRPEAEIPARVSGVADLSAFLGLSPKMTNDFLGGFLGLTARGKRRVFNRQQVIDLRAVLPLFIDETRAAGQLGRRRIGEALGIRYQRACRLVRRLGIPAGRRFTEAEFIDVLGRVRSLMEEEARAAKQRRENRQTARQRRRDEKQRAEDVERQRVFQEAIDRAKKRVKQSPLIRAEPRQQRALETERKCLRCQRPFMSQGPGNRMCDPCKRNTAW